MASAYREFLGQRHASYLITTNLVGRLQNSMATLALSIYLRHEGLNYRWVGALVGIYAAAGALCGPALGRTVDKHGQVKPLIVSAIGTSAGSLLLLSTGARNVVLTAGALVLAGALVPPLDGCLRSIWPTVRRGERAVNAAYSLDAALQEVLFVVGPLLVTALVVGVSPQAAVSATAAAALLGTLAFAAAPPVRRWTPPAREPHWLGPLRSRDLRFLLASLGCVGIAFGVFDIAVVAYAEQIQIPAMAGILLGAQACTALVSGLVFGSRGWPGTARQQMVWLLGGLVVCYMPLLSVGSPVVMVVAMGLTGLCLSPVLATAFIIIGQVAPKGTATEAFTWMLSIVGTGMAIGSALAGALEPVGLRAVLGGPVVAACSALIITLAGRVTRRSEAIAAA